MKPAKFLVGALGSALLLLSLHAAGASDSEREREIRSIYKNLIDAENRHDLTAVRELVWNSPSTLFVAKAPVGWHGYWGIEDVLQHLRDMYQQPFRIDPIYEEEKVVFLTPEIAETYVPVRISVAYAGQNPAPKPFVMVLVWIHTPQGWKMTTDKRRRPPSRCRSPRRKSSAIPLFSCSVIFSPLGIFGLNSRRRRQRSAGSGGTGIGMSSALSTAPTVINMLRNSERMSHGVWFWTFGRQPFPYRIMEE